jgi:calcium-dependent protein kinase
LSDLYDFGEILGSGSYGEVFKCKNRETKKEVAIKLIKKKSISNYKNIDEEILALTLVDHPNLIKLYEHYQTKKKVILVTELLEGEELYQRLMKSETFTEEIATTIFKQVLESINYIHNHNITHRDIKPENFIFESKDPTNFNLKLIDFGLSSSCGMENSESNQQVPIRSMRTVVGTTWYMAPEVFDAKYNQLCDIWSAGVILYIILCGFPPFYGDNKVDIE